VGKVSKDDVFNASGYLHHLSVPLIIHASNGCGLKLAEISAVHGVLFSTGLKINLG